MSPPDRFGLVWLIMVFLGMGTLFPWNIFIMQIYYFETRLQVKPTWQFMEDNFENILVIGFQVSNCVMLGTLVAVKQLPMCFKILVPYSVIMLTMFIQTLIVFVCSLSGINMSFLILASVMVMGVTSAVVQGGVYTKAAMLPLKYINAVIGGQGVAGFTVSLVSFITLATGPPQHHKSSSSSSSSAIPWIQRYQSTVQKPAFYYFMTATIVMFLCIIGYVVLIYHPFVQYHVHKYQVAIKRRKQGWGQRTGKGSDDVQEPLLNETKQGEIQGDQDVQVETASSNESQVLSVEQDAGGTLMHLEGYGQVYDIEGIGFSFCPAVHVVRVTPEYHIPSLIRASVDQKNFVTTDSERRALDKRKSPRSHSLDYRMFSNIFKILHKEESGQNTHTNGNNTQYNGKNQLQHSTSDDELVSWQQRKKRRQDTYAQSGSDYEETVIDVDGYAYAEKEHSSQYGLIRLLKDVGLYAFVVFLTFFIDMCVFPAVSAMIHSTSANQSTMEINFFERLSQDLYMPCLFVLFTSGEMIGRFACGYGPWARKAPPAYILLLYNLFQATIAVGLLFCNVIPVNGQWRLPVILNSNVWPLLINGLLGLITGHCGGTAMMHAPGMVPASQRERCGNLITFGFGGGLTLGAFVSLAIVTSLETRS
eukprot:TRINITY_DN10941_c0_g1_i1.p1 TRINITY_DN10941_c0_g1~~TRINITY_DN10941_c0_g1_i1.p1  ORF type:complete len:647 (+),score=33.86 TRINITY_DN10941_c0_g1_i1:446-2386(+)